MSYIKVVSRSEIKKWNEEVLTRLESSVLEVVLQLSDFLPIGGMDFQSIKHASKTNILSSSEKNLSWQS